MPFFSKKDRAWQSVQLHNSREEKSQMSPALSIKDTEVVNEIKASSFLLFISSRIGISVSHLFSKMNYFIRNVTHGGFDDIYWVQIPSIPCSQETQQNAVTH